MTDTQKQELRDESELIRDTFSPYLTDKQWYWINRLVEIEILVAREVQDNG